MIASLPSGLVQAQAEAKVLELQWSAPNACLSESAARSAISQLIRSERSAGERARARVLIEGSEQAGYVAEIEVERGPTSGERTLRGARCSEVSEAAVLIIAMAIDPEGASARAAERTESSTTAQASSSAAQNEAARAKAEEAKAEASKAKAQDAEQAQAEEAQEQALEQQELEEEEADEPDQPSDPRDGRYALGVLGTGDLGSLPHATVGGGVIAGLHWPRIRLELQLLAYLPQIEQRGPTPGSSEKISLYTGAITGCFDLLGTRDQERALGGCAAIEAGLSQGDSRSISDGRASQGLWLAGLAGLDVRQQVVGPFHLRLFAGAGLPILRPSYEIGGFGHVFKASPVLGRFGISAFVLFP